MTPLSHLIMQSVKLLKWGLGWIIYVIEVLGANFLDQRGGRLQVVFLAGCHVHANTILPVRTHVCPCFRSNHIIFVVILRVEDNLLSLSLTFFILFILREFDSFLRLGAFNLLRCGYFSQVLQPVLNDLLVFVAVLVWVITTLTRLLYNLSISLLAAWHIGAHLGHYVNKTEFSSLVEELILLILFVGIQCILIVIY